MEDFINSNGGCQSAQPESSSSAESSEQKLGVIYKITCLISGKFYVGKTKQSLNRRITQHKYDSKKGSLGIGAAIAKYGWENFTVEVIETCPVEQLNEREIFWIAELKSKAPNGYNLTDGGDGGRGCSPSAETRAKISAKLKGRPAPNKGKKCLLKHVFGCRRLKKLWVLYPHLLKVNTVQKKVKLKCLRLSLVRTILNTVNIHPRKHVLKCLSHKRHVGRGKKLLNAAAKSDTLSRVSLMIFLEVIYFGKSLL